jgi:hypothetical protein
MAQVTDYTTLAAAIDTWDERTHDSDELIGLAEAEFRLYLGPNFAKETSTTLTFASGSAALPAGYVRTLALTHSVYGTLGQRSIAAVRSRRIADASGIPDIFAITGSTVETAPSYTGDLTFDYEGTLAGLTSSNATNWLITNAPQAYLSMCLSMAKAKFEDYQSAAVLRSQAISTLNDLGIQSMVGQLSRASVTIPGATP